MVYLMMPGLPSSDPGNASLSQASAGSGVGEMAMAVHGEPRYGDNCPACGQARLEYDGLLNLSCARCGLAMGGSFT